MNDDTKTERICQLNDEFRTTFDPRLGRVVMTRGIAALSEMERAEIIAAVTEFDAFDDSNDPHNEHDLVNVEIQGRAVLAKLDYYDRDCRFHSPDPADPEVTRRVLTIMLASEY